jgi:hypothetical protein
MSSTGWYIEHNVMSSSPLIFFPLSFTFGKVSGTPMSLSSKFLAVSILIIFFPLFLCAWSKVGDRMMHTPPVLLSLGTRGLIVWLYHTVSHFPVHIVPMTLFLSLRS